MSYRFNVEGLDLAPDFSDYAFAGDHEAMIEGVRLLEQFIRDDPEGVIAGGRLRIEVARDGEAIGCLTIACSTPDGAACV